MILGPLKFSNYQKEVIQFLKSVVPADVFVGSQVPTSRKKKMIIVINGGGSPSGDIRASVRINLMVWYGDTWEATQDFAYEVDALMQGLNEIPHPSIIDVKTAVMPVPSGDGESVETPVVSSAYNLVIASKNS